ncbi:phosphotransferase [Devosia nitrariae]|uniref:Trifolitoxin immunity domain-containing protein n=1 Tax=Devosia nitrariae TaxID=2071872 RepID=A0ABQ5WB25_9HYPH|nr:phosphotransferase [Devosia nitrariae]GLQ57261.1 trifolitoxin immunity domain-containing protein [Devosia nitrariae]
MEEPEIALTGGRVTAGVVRIGDTVRRPISRDRTLQHDLLSHLEAKGFVGTPRLLGVDEMNREVLSFIAGEVPADLGHFTDEQLHQAARLLRRFHDATVDLPAVVAAGAEVMCHNDWGPPNCVLIDGMPCGIIDFDTLAPGPRLWDLGYSAFSWLDIGNDDEYSGKEQIRRLGVFLDGYGMASLSVSELAVFVVARQSALSTWAHMQGKPEMAEWAAACREWTVREVLEPILPTAFPEARMTSRAAGFVSGKE